MKRNLLSQKAVLASLNFTGWTARRLDKKITNEVNRSHGASHDAGRYNKLLVGKNDLEAIQKVISAARIKHYDMTQPWLDNGARILPSALYVEYSAAMRGFQRDYEIAIDDLITRWPEIVREARGRLNGMFNASDYPPQSQLRRLYTFDVKILPCPDATDFRVDMADEHADDIRADIEKRMKAALDDAMKEPMRRIIDVVGHMAERLKAYKPATRDGDKTEGSFRDSLVDNVISLVDLLPAFNLTNDAALADVTARMQQELCHTTAQELRDNPKTRKSVAKAAEAILADVTQFMS